MRSSIKVKPALDAIKRAHDRSLMMIGIKLKSQAQINITKKGARDTGHLVNSIATNVTADTVTCGTNLNYAYYVERGSGPHKTNYKKEEFAESMKGWFARHGIEDKGIQYLIMRSIRKHGTSAKPFLRPALDQTKRSVNGILKASYMKELA